MKKAILTCFAALGLSIGCSSSEPGPGAASSSSLKTVAAFCEAWATAVCNDEVVSACDATSKDSCILSQELYCRELIPTGYDQANAKGCIDAVEEAYVDADLESDELELVLQLTAPCDQLVRGLGGAGDDCATSTDCNTLEGLRCVIKAGATEGTCQIPVEVGGGFGCSGLDEVCAAGFYCDGENCLSRKDTGDSCSYDPECSADLRCNAAVVDDAPPEGECVARKESGQPCASDVECESNLCAAPRGVATGTCVSRVRLSAESAFCQDLR